MYKVLGAALCLLTGMAHAEIRAVDDTGQTVVLAEPARRIVALAPHATEMLFAAGAGERVVGTVEFSDYPAEARSLPRVGRFSRLDLEAILTLRPDLVVAWDSGNAPAQVAQLKQLGIPVYATEPRRVLDIARDLEQLGRLAGTEAAARSAAGDIRRRHQALRKRYAGKTPVRVFYQIWNQPLMSVNGEHLISDVIRLCGGRNVFAGLPALAPRIGVEAVLARDPQVIIASGMGKERPEWLAHWRQWPSLSAVRHGHLFFIPPDLLQRPSPRILDGAQRLCRQIDRARAALP